MTKYKVGDRVRSFGNGHKSRDVGIVFSIEGDKVWARWDSDNQRKRFDIDSENYEKISEVNEELEAKIARLEEIVDALKATISVLSNHIMKFEK